MRTYRLRLWIKRTHGAAQVVRPRSASVGMDAHLSVSCHGLDRV